MMSAHSKSSSSRSWELLASLWGAWYFAIFIFGNEEITQIIIWGGALIVGAATTPIFLKHFRWCHLLPEVQLLGIFWLWTITGLLVAVDLDLFARNSKLILEFLLILLLQSFIIANSGAIKPMLVAFLAVGAGLTLSNVAGLDTGISLESTRQIQQVKDANFVGFMAVVGVMGGLAMFPEVRSRMFRGVLLIGMGLSIYGLVLSGSRGAFVMFYVLIALWLSMSGATIIRSRLAYVSILIIIVMVGYYFYQFVMAETNLGRRLLLAQGLQDDSTQTRIELFFSAWNVFLDYPLFGAGLGQYGYASGMGMYAHTDAAEILGTTGPFGMIIYYSMYLVTWRRLNYLRRYIQNPTILYRINSARISLLVMIIAGIFFRINFVSQETMFLYAYIVGVSLWAKRVRKIVQPIGCQPQSPPLLPAFGVLDKRP